MVLLQSKTIKRIFISTFDFIFEKNTIVIHSFIYIHTSWLQILLQSMFHCVFELNETYFEWNGCFRFSVYWFRTRYCVAFVFNLNIGNDINLESEVEPNTCNVIYSRVRAIQNCLIHKLLTNCFWFRKYVNNVCIAMWINKKNAWRSIHCKWAFNILF